MKRKVLLLVLALAILLLPICANAVTQEEWNLSCNRKTSGTTTVYKLGTLDEYQCTIPAGTYVKITNSTDEYYVISYMISGVSGRSVVKNDTLIGTSSQYRGSDGLAHGVHELDPEHDELVSSHAVTMIAPSLLEESDKDYYAMVIFSQPGGLAEQEALEASQRLRGESTSSSTQASSGTASSTTSASSGSTTSQSSSSSTQSSAPDTTVQGENAVSVSLQTLGSYETTVVMNGETQDVMTADLSFGEDVPADKALAVVYAPRTGKISLRNRASDSATVSGRLKAGQLVAVMRYGQDYCYVSTGSKGGYAKTASLQFHAPITTDDDIASAQLAYKGKTNGSTTINIRLEPDNDSRKIGEFRTGTPIIVLGSADGWTQIEVNGLRGYVMSAFVVGNN